jgi:uncharacterized Zn finger protein (UPF0148 family)
MTDRAQDTEGLVERRIVNVLEGVLAGWPTKDDSSAYRVYLTGDEICTLLAHLRTKAQGEPEIECGACGWSQWRDAGYLYCPGCGMRFESPDSDPGGEARSRAALANRLELMARATPGEIKGDPTQVAVDREWWEVMQRDCSQAAEALLRAPDSDSGVEERCDHRNEEWAGGPVVHDGLAYVCLDCGARLPEKPTAPDGDPSGEELPTLGSLWGACPDHPGAPDSEERVVRALEPKEGEDG